MSEIKVNSIKGVGASAAAITVNNTDGTCTANITNNLSNRNLIINGAMNVAQRGTSSTGLGASAGYFTLDRYRTAFSNTAGRVTMEQVADVHDGFANAMKFSCTTADTSIGSNEYFLLQQKIEGQDLQQLKKGSSDAEEFTVSFYVKGNASATYVVEMFDLNNSRQISKTFSVTTNWTRVELTFPADTTGTLANDNAASLQLGIWLHAGSTYTSGTLNSSAFAVATSANRAVGISSIFDSTDRTFFLTGLQMEVGSVATDFEHRSFGQELALCQRYYFRLENDASTTCHLGTMQYYSDNDFFGGLMNLPVEMRAIPTATLSGSGKVWSAGGNANGSFTSLNINKNSKTSLASNGSSTSGTGGNNGYATPVTLLQSSYIDASAEL